MASNKMTEGRVILEDFRSLTTTSSADDNNPPCPCSNSSLRRVVWTYKVVDAIKLARRFRDPVIVAVEYRHQGSRLFVAASRKHIFHYLCFLRTRRPQFRTWHEIFSGLTPMRLYFDLDFYFETNPNVDVRRLVDDFCRLIADILRDRFVISDEEVGAAGEKVEIRFVHLDATTAEKFSRHIIARVVTTNGVEMVFKNAKAIHQFVSEQIVPKLNNEEDGKDGFYIRPKSGGSDAEDFVPLIDLVVYNNEKGGQNFRLLGSPKFGRDNVLRLLPPPSADDETVEHEFSFHSADCDVCERSFLASLATASVALRAANPILVDGRVQERQLISDKNLEKYRADVITEFGEEADILLQEKFGSKCCLYNEISQFESRAGLFYRRIREDIFDDLIEAFKRSDFYENLPEDENSLSEYVGLFKAFKKVMAEDPIDWDEIYGIASDLLIAVVQQNAENIDPEEEEELRLRPAEIEVDLNSARRLRLLYTKIAKLMAEQKTVAGSSSAAKLFENTENFDKAKKIYDSYLEVLRKSKKSVFPDGILDTLTRDNFRAMFDILENLDRCESERRDFKRTREQRMFDRKLKTLRIRIEEEREFREWLQNRLNQQHEAAGDRRKVAAAAVVERAIRHSAEVTEYFRKRIETMENVPSRGGEPSTE